MLKISAATSYCIDTKSDFIYQLVKNYIFKINHEAGIDRGQSLFGQYIVESDNPSTGDYIITRKMQDNIAVLSLDKRPAVIEAIAIVINNTDSNFITACKQKLKDKHIDSIYYYMSVLNIIGYENDQRVKQVIEYDYKGYHTQKEKYDMAIRLVQNPEPENIYKAFKIFNSSNGGFKALANIIAELVYLENIPPYIMEIHRDTIKNQAFVNSLLHITTSIITSSNKEEFALKLIANRGKL